VAAGVSGQEARDGGGADGPRWWREAHESLPLEGRKEDPGDPRSPGLEGAALRGNPENENALVNPSPEDRWAPLEARLRERTETGRFRALEHFEPNPGRSLLGQGSREFLDFSSNDYLGLASDAALAERASEYAFRYGTGAGASRLVTGGMEIHARLEAGLAAFTRRPCALLFGTGFQANASIIPALVGREGLVLFDRLSHHSILQGALLSRARRVRFRHNDVDHLEALLSRHPSRPGSSRLIVTESIFSMDGDRAPLESICEVAERHGAILMVDDAHAVGVWGPDGEGLAPIHERVDLVLGTFGKAFGSSGAYVACHPRARDLLVNFCGGLIYSTALPPPLIGAVEAALERIQVGAAERESYREGVRDAHVRFREVGLDPSPSDTQILPLRFGTEEAALACASHLRERGILGVAIRPPTVPAGTSRLRITLHRTHSRDDVDRLLAALGEHSGTRDG